MTDYAQVHGELIGSSQRGKLREMLPYLLENQLQLLEQTLNYVVYEGKSRHCGASFSGYPDIHQATALESCLQRICTCLSPKAAIGRHRSDDT